MTGQDGATRGGSAKSRLRRRAVLIGVAAGAAVAIASGAWACTINMSGTLTLTPNFGPAGTNVNVTASGQLAGVNYNILYIDPAAFFAGKPCHSQGTNLGNATASVPGGGFTKNVTIPPTVGAPTTGTAEICNQDSASGQVSGAHAYFTVT